MNLGELTSLTTCPRCGFSIPIYANEEYTKCRNCEKKINLKINNMFKGEKEMVKDFETTNTYSTGDKVLYNGKIETIGEVIKSTIDTSVEYVTKERLKPDYIDHVRELIQEELNKPLDVKIKYHDPLMPKLEKITKGNWIDCRVIEGGTITKFDEYGKPEKYKAWWTEVLKKNEDGEVYATKILRYKKGDFMMLCLGMSLNQGEGYEVNLVPRSGTFKNFHIIQTNHYGVGDDTFVGNGDIYHFPCYALADGEIELYDRVCQMRINKAMGQVNFTEVDDMEAEDRGGFSSTGTK